VGLDKQRTDIRGALDEVKLGDFQGNVSLPVESGKARRMAAKVVDDRGIQLLKEMALTAPGT
jgi:hypothetical protein